MNTFQNVQRELLHIMLKTNSNVFSLKHLQISRMDDELLEWGRTISGQIAPKARPLSRYRDWKAAELRKFSRDYALILFDETLPSAYMYAFAIPCGVCGYLLQNCGIAQ